LPAGPTIDSANRQGAREFLYVGTTHATAAPLSAQASE